MFNRKLTATLQALSSTDFYIALFVAGSLAVTNVALAAWETLRVTRILDEMAKADVCTFGVTLPLRSMRIAAALALVTVGLACRKARGFYVSLAALAWIGAEYGLWYLESQRLLSNVNRHSFPDYIPHVFNMYRLTSWYAMVLLVSPVLLFWESKVLLGSLIDSDIDNSDPLKNTNRGHE